MTDLYPMRFYLRYCSPEAFGDDIVKKMINFLSFLHAGSGVLTLATLSGRPADAEGQIWAVGSSSSP